MTVNNKHPIIQNWYTGKKAAIIASITLVAYVLIALVVINLGQKKLEEARHNELNLKGIHYAELLSTYFSRTQNLLEITAKDKAIMTFFANKSAGMSMKYGLSASLFNVEKLIKDLTTKSDRNNNIPFLSHVSIITKNGTVITDSIFEKSTYINTATRVKGEGNTDETILSSANLSLQSMKGSKQKILAGNSGGQLSIIIGTNIYFQNTPIAILFAEINPRHIAQHISNQEYSSSGSRIGLFSEGQKRLIWNSIKPTEQNKKHQRLDQFHYVQENINNTPITLMAWFEHSTEVDVFTSKWFTVIISLLSIPVFLGVFYLVKVERKNILLTSEVSHSKQKQQATILHNIELETEIRRRKSSEKMLAHQASHDVLTNLPNRALSFERLKQGIHYCSRQNKKLLVMYIDLDNFKQINDTLGHNAGDEVLIRTSQRLLNTVRKTDTVSRLSGDEFMLIIPDLKSQQQATDLAAKVLHLFERPFILKDQPLHTSVSIGLAIYPDNGKSSSSIIQSADMALYRAKESGRNNFNFFESAMNDEVNRKVLVSKRLREAIKHNSLEMYYQPLIDLKTQKIMGAEALMRWTDDELGFVSPEEFINIAESNGLMNKLGNFALYQSCKQAALWQKILPLQIAINFSSVQFRDCQSLLTEIKSVLADTGLPAEKLDVEVTESLLINQTGEIVDMLKLLRDMGTQLSIDDFGTGYSALSYLQKFSFTKLKIDRAFIMNLIDNSADQSLVTAIVAMAKALNLKIVAEGIETTAQMELLTRLECNYGQGYLYSKPVPAQEFEALLNKQMQNT